ncbi:MAG TPA: c-type cytochrome [Mariprofundaceae bacterium]|nr:c-type cytochrome [Mariprofundaceae bacterium]
MKKMLIVAAALACMAGGFVTSASAGVMCAACHDGHKDKVGPALATAVKAYGSVDELFAFLNSGKDLEPKVAAFAGKKAIMASQLKKYRAMSDEKKAEVRAWVEAAVK